MACSSASHDMVTSMLNAPHNSACQTPPSDVSIHGVVSLCVCVGRLSSFLPLAKQHAVAVTLSHVLIKVWLERLSKSTNGSLSRNDEVV
eukprot:5877159-Amphidinium_carterae.2